jgi:hypothetical protein
LRPLRVTTVGIRPLRRPKESSQLLFVKNGIKCNISLLRLPFLFQIQLLKGSSFPLDHFPLSLPQGLDITPEGHSRHYILNRPLEGVLLSTLEFLLLSVQTIKIVSGEVSIAPNTATDALEALYRRLRKVIKRPEGRIRRI